MIRKLKNILNNKENFHSSNDPTQYGSSQITQMMLKSNNFSAKSGSSSNGSSNESPVNYIKKKIRSTKSWVKMPAKSSRLFEEESAYDSISSLEPANHEFETYTRNTNIILMTNGSNNQDLIKSSGTTTTTTTSSVDYGFEEETTSNNNSVSPSTTANNSTSNNQRSERQKHSTLNNFNGHQSNKNIANLLNQKAIVDPSNEISEISNINSNYFTNQVETNLYRKMLEKLQKSSIESPANIPLLCIESFNKNESKWSKLNSRFMSSGINIRLVEINKGAPINAMFYLSDLDMIYVKTYNFIGDDMEGYVPRSCLSVPTSSNEKIYKEHILSKFNNQSKKINQSDYASGQSNIRSKNFIDDSIKYHSLNSDQIDEDDDNSNQHEQYTNLSENDNQPRRNSFFLVPSNLTNTTTAKENENDVNIIHKKNQGHENLTHFSVSNYQLVNDYEETSDIFGDKKDNTPSKCLLSLQSRSRLPISIKSNLNLALMAEQQKAQSTNQISFNNFTYKSPQVILNRENQLSACNKKPPPPPPPPSFQPHSFSRIQTPKEIRKVFPFERKSARRSLDSSISNYKIDSKMYSVSIEIDETREQMSKLYNINESVNNSKILADENLALLETKNCNNFADLDIKKIELDSLRDNEANETDKNSLETENSNEIKEKAENKIWTVILKHEARNFQEISVIPGMVVQVIKEYSDWIYIRLMGSDNSQIQLSQQYGLIPRSCVIDLQEIIYKSAKNLNNLELSKRRKSQITAL